MGEVIAFPTRQKRLDQIEEELLKVPEKGNYPCYNGFGPGLYFREMHAPAGHVILGHTHKTAHTCLLMKGSMRLLAEDGSIREIKAPMIFVAPPGRKLALTLEDVIFVNIHATEETDVAKLEEQLIDKSQAWTQHQLKEGAKILSEGAPK